MHFVHLYFCMITHVCWSVSLWNAHIYAKSYFLNKQNTRNIFCKKTQRKLKIIQGYVQIMQNTRIFFWGGGEGKWSGCSLEGKKEKIWLKFYSVFEAIISFLLYHFIPMQLIFFLLQQPQPLHDIIYPDRPSTNCYHFLFASYLEFLKVSFFLAECPSRREISG